MNRALKTKQKRRQPRRAEPSSLANDSSKPVPGLAPAPLVHFPREVISNAHDPGDAFILSLALAFNDLKGPSWWIHILDTHKPESQLITPLRGEWAGMRLQATRLSLLVFYEVLKAIESAADSGVLAIPKVAAAIDNPAPEARRSWAQLLALATTNRADDEGLNDIQKYLLRMRNDVTAHYYQPKALHRGYRAFFYEPPGGPYNLSAMASLGNDMKSTRFYFADAAAQGAHRRLDPDDAVMKRVSQYIAEMAEALTNIVGAYLVASQEKIRASSK